jgi:hypothetical protein
VGSTVLASDGSPACMMFQVYLSNVQFKSYLLIEKSITNGAFDYSTGTSNVTGTFTSASSCTGKVNYNGSEGQAQFNFVATSSIDVPNVTTTAPSFIKMNRAKSGGKLTDDGGASITVRGICWGTTSSPTIANSKTTDGTGAGVFTSSEQV